MLVLESLLIFLILSCTQATIRADLLVQTPVGSIRGLRANDGNYSMFLGVPYAEVDRANPFGPSTPYQKFETVFEANDDTVKCPCDDETGEAVGSLDCLRLNIYVPDSASSQNPLPAMVWIHGGDFERGNASRIIYGPKFLVRHDVILVTLNYRVGLYGYMCLDIPEVSGNQGLKDQVLALRWVRKNIAAFGGNANNVTLFGQSTGARSVDFHLFSPQEKLFNNVILQSGTSLTRDTIYDADTEAPVKLAEKLGFPVNSVYDALDYLATVDPHLTIEAALDLGLVIKPCVEKHFEGVEQFITDYTINLDVPKVKNMPILLGYNNNEQIARYAERDPSFFNDLNIFYERLNNYFDFEENQLKEAEKIVRHFYIGDEETSEKNTMLCDIVDFDSAFSYIHPTQRIIDIYKANGAGDIFYYVFSYVGERNVFKVEHNVTLGGCSHIDDLGYLFDLAVLNNDPKPEDQLLIDRMTTLWTNFAKFGNPTPEKTELLPVTWTPITDNAKYYMDIATEMKLGKRPFHNQTAFWDLFFSKYGKYQKGFKGNSELKCQNAVQFLKFFEQIFIQFFKTFL